MSLYGIPQIAGNVVSGLAGITLLATGANTVAILAAAVQRAVIEGANLAYAVVTGSDSKVDNTKTVQKDKPRSSVLAYVDMLTPYKATSFQYLATSGLTNLVAATVSLYVLNRFCPALVTSANSLLRHVVGIQFTPHHIPLTRLAGL